MKVQLKRVIPIPNLGAKEYIFTPKWEYHRIVDAIESYRRPQIDIEKYLEAAAQSALDDEIYGKVRDDINELNYRLQAFRPSNNHDWLVVERLRTLTEKIKEKLK